MSPEGFPLPVQSSRWSPGCVSGHIVHLKRLHAAWHKSAQDAWVGSLTLFLQAQRETVGPDSGHCRNTHTPQHIKLSPRFLILLTVAGRPSIGQRFHSDVWNRSEAGIVVPRKLPQKGQVLQHTFPLFL